MSEEFTKEVSGVRPEQWKKMTETLRVVKGFLDVEPSNMFTTLKDDLITSIKLKIEEGFAPLLNELTETMNAIINPLIEDYIKPLIEEMTAFFVENKVGAGVGGIAGGVLGLMVGHPLLGAFIGSIVGASLESFYNQLDAAVQGTSGLPYSPDVKTLYEQETGNVFTSIFTWDYINWFKNYKARGTYLPGRIGGIQEP